MEKDPKRNMTVREYVAFRERQLEENVIACARARFEHLYHNTYKPLGMERDEYLWYCSPEVEKTASTYPGVPVSDYVDVEAEREEMRYWISKLHDRPTSQYTL